MFMRSRSSKVDDYKYCNCNLANMKEHSGAKLMQAEVTQGIAIILLLVIVAAGEVGAGGRFLCSPGKTLHSQSIKLIFENVVFLERGCRDSPSGWQYN